MTQWAAEMIVDGSAVLAIFLREAGYRMAPALAPGGKPIWR
jgi:PIN domain nuclease of toxin-antitoxin system